MNERELKVLADLPVETMIEILHMANIGYLDCIQTNLDQKVLQVINAPGPVTMRHLRNSQQYKELVETIDKLEEDKDLAFTKYLAFQNLGKDCGGIDPDDQCVDGNASPEVCTCGQCPDCLHDGEEGSYEWPLRP